MADEAFSHRAAPPAMAETMVGLREPKLSLTQ
jgi:hypothetical protein